MIKVTMTLYTSKKHNTIRTEEFEFVSVVDVDDKYIRIVNCEGILYKVETSEVVGYTAEVI